MLIGFIPVIFLLFLSGELYEEKMQRVSMISNHINKIHESGEISKLISELEMERKFSYEYALRKNGFGDLTSQRQVTDKALEILKKSEDPEIANFENYTFLNKLPEIRENVDSSPHYDAENIMEYYTDAIFRLNTLNTFSNARSTYLTPITDDLVSQRKLFEMITYLGIIRTNIYNALYTKKNIRETLKNTLGIYKIFKSYQTEFLLKAPPEAIINYENEKNVTDLKPTLDYLEKVFNTLKIDSTYTAEQWWKISSNGRNILKKQQLDFWQKAESGMEQIYQKEILSRNETLLILIVTVLLVIGLIAYTIKVITEMLKELKLASEKISIGGTGIHFENMPNDVIGSVAKSILQIDKNNIELAHAASAIGKGDFDVEVKPRSSEDLLGNSIEKMKEDLHQLTMEKDKIQQETLELMNRKDDFLSIASHELKTPVTSLKAYVQLLDMDLGEGAENKRKMMLSKIDSQIDKLTTLINDLLDTSKMQQGKLVYNKMFFELNALVNEVIEEIQTGRTGSQKIIFNSLSSLKVYADRERIGQVLSNFLSNAIKYCPGCESIIVNLEEVDNMAVCSVQDFGEGIKKDQQEKIFERFYRVTGKNLHTYPGMGLGLFISKEIMERHNGKIWLKSEPGKGSIFYFSLPIAEK